MRGSSGCVGAPLSARSDCADAGAADARHHRVGDCAPGSRGDCAETRPDRRPRPDSRQTPEEFLNRPENRTTRDQSQFLNELIERKAFSWTRVLENLEKVMPPRVHLVSISPELDDDNQLALKMTVAGDSRDRAIELARRMEESRRFAQTNIIREAHFESQTGDTEQFEIAAIYIPEPLIGAATPRRRAVAASAKPATPQRPKPNGAEKGANTDARSAANPEESEDRAGGSWQAWICWRRAVLFAAGGFGGIAAHGTEPTAGRAQ